MKLLFSIDVFGHTSSIGCGRCTVVGYRHWITNAVVFPAFDCSKMTDDGFRKQEYDQQKGATPLVELPIDMVNDFAIGDSLHLIDLGIMKTIIRGLMKGELTNIDAKWSGHQIDQINLFLESAKVPIEIKSQRTVRSLVEFSRWKGREFRVFFLYLSLVIFRNTLKDYLFQHHLLLYCAITICYSDVYLQNYINVAEKCIQHYLIAFKNFYGDQHVTSNFHLLCHLIDDVKRFGKLDSFNAYPFESKLFYLKNLITNGNLPLSQIAKRISEQDHFGFEKKKNLLKFSMY